MISLQPILASVAGNCGLQLKSYQPVTGGDINDAYCLYDTSNSKYFLKVNDAQAFPAMFIMEADGLDALRATSNISVPGVISKGIAGNRQWLLLQWLEKGAITKNSMEAFGAALATMHRQPQPHFGWPANNYIGSLHQINTPHDEWQSFFTQCRIMPLVKKLFDAGLFSTSDVVVAASFCKQAMLPEEPPSLLHGDLWSGNYLIDTNGHAAIFDPAVYYGHREIDLGMTKLFGGFNESFYAAYHEVYPLQPGWQQRLYITQLYPLLVHAVLFGGHYIGSVQQILRKAE